MKNKTKGAIKLTMENRLEPVKAEAESGVCRSPLPFNT